MHASMNAALSHAAAAAASMRPPGSKLKPANAGVQVHCLLLQQLTQHHEGSTARLEQQIAAAQQAAQDAAALYDAEAMDAELELSQLSEEFRNKMKQACPVPSVLLYGPVIWQGHTSQAHEERAFGSGRPHAQADLASACMVALCLVGCAVKSHHGPKTPWTCPATRMACIIE